MALSMAPPPLPGMAPPESRPMEQRLAESRASGMGGAEGMSAQEHLKIAGQHILQAAKANPAVADGAGEVIGLLTKLTEASMAGESPTGGPAMPPGPPGGPPMGGPPMGPMA
jgi:hypothetical protein